MAREPERSCVGCRRRAPKAVLLRVARTPGGVRPDPTATAPGRGAYVHRDPDCVVAALRKGTLARALRTGLSERELARLREDIEEASQGT
ncbi:MAG TPA: YlxR family protein [Actinomycetota bacterium]|nr:YlxR family protein [Actinomycetota bacterium]